MLFGVTFIDFLLGPLEFAREAAWLRLLFMMPPIIAALGLTCYKRALWARQLAGIAVGVSVCATSTAIAAMATTLDQPTVAGSYFIVIVFGYFFLGLRYQLAAIMATVLVLAYIPIALLSGAQDAGAVHNGYYLLVMNIICAAGARQLELARRRDFLNSSVLTYRANHDALSGLPNRRAFDEYLQNAWTQSGETQASLAVLLLDIDHFKAYNDHYGHQRGDEAITRVGQVIRNALERPQDFAARYGGEEFAVVLIDTGLDSARALGEKLRQQLFDENIPHAAAASSDRITVSVGASQVVPRSGDSGRAALIKMADQALYTAKQQGRNCVVATRHSAFEGHASVGSPGAIPAHPH
jgi:diguanylate cyclase (GGDEF)-like protein